MNVVPSPTVSVSFHQKAEQVSSFIIITPRTEPITGLTTNLR